MLAPIVLFAYLRPFHTQKTLDALANNQLAKSSNLYIFIDGLKENATEEQKSTLRRGCEFNCNRPKYYNKIASCLTAGDTCKAFSTCIMKEMQTNK